MENYFASQRDHIFRNVEVLIYVFDVESREVCLYNLFNRWYLVDNCLLFYGISLSLLPKNWVCNRVLKYWFNYIQLEKDMHYYQSCLEAILQNSRGAKIFCLIHKMDLVQEEQRDAIFLERETELKRRSLPLDITCFRTSIWDETLYKVWDLYCIVVNDLY